MAQVLVTHSYHLPFDAKQQRKMQPYAPLGTLYAAAALREAGISVAVFDSMLADPSIKLPALLTEHRPGIVVVYEDDFNFLSKMCLTRMREVAREIAENARAIGAVTIAHGSDATDSPEIFLENGFDYVLCGEAEGTLVELCGAILRGDALSEIDGLVRRDASGNILRGGERTARNSEWPSLPLPARDLIDLEPYRAAWQAAHGYFSTNMVASRGCPYRCNWCAKPISGNRFHLRPAAAVAEEMRLLKKEAQVDHIWFGDDVFALDHRWAHALAEEVAKRNAAVPFKIQSRANLMTEQTVRDLKTAGCAEVWMGVESGSQAVLTAMDKDLSLDTVVKARNLLRRAEIRACYFLQFGYPGERWKELQETIAFVRRTRPDDIGISFSYPLPGTVFYERVRREMGEKRNWVDSDDLCIMFQAAYRTDFYCAARDALHAEVDSWKEHDSGRAEARVADLWRRVAEIEPESRNAEAFAPGAGAPPMASAFVPLDKIAPAERV